MTPRRSLRPAAAAWLVLLIALSASPPALAQNAPGPSCTTVKDCADLIVTIAAELKQENETLRKMIAAVVPAGAVVAFDLKDGCPDGWSPYTEGAGKFILVAGEGTLRDNDNRTPLTERKAGQQGGAEAVTLSLDQIPRHDHEMKGVFDGTGLPEDARGTKYMPGGHNGRSIYGEPSSMWRQGGGRAHENMPPFIVVDVCKKN